MNSRTKRLLACVCIASLNVFGAIPFQNLDFESARLIPIPGSLNRVAFGAAFPSWDGYLGTSRLDSAYNNDYSLSGAGITLWGPNFPEPNEFHERFFVQLKGTKISQVGAVPMDAKSFRLWSSSSIVLPLAVMVDGQWLPMVKLGPSPNPNGISYVWGGDISAFAGHTVELSLGGDTYLDYLQFSPVPIPEPAPLVLIGLGVAGLRLVPRRRRRI